ncbi:MAG TPA: ATP-binding protein [Jatrophihabitantaceae bacterium]|jgi:signal transduction histidine kinase|nr:ATP-binding protein [Jatrophihabitantaceae bacterium]
MSAGDSGELGTCNMDELRMLFLFEKLTDEQLRWLCREGRVEIVEPGWVFREGEAATCFYVLLEGSIVQTRRVGQDDVEITRTDQRGVYAGAFQAYLGDRVPQTYVNSTRATTRARFFVLDAVKFAALMQDWFPMAQHLLEGLFFGTRSIQQLVGQRERLLALGALSAGLTHELNNPAAAAARATSSLRERITGMRRKLGVIAAGEYDRSSLDALISLQQDAVERMATVPGLTPMEATDREERLGEWLASRSIGGSWNLAATFVQAGVDESFLERVRAGVGDPMFDGAVQWLYYTVETELLISEIQDSTTRISALVAAARQYSQMDRAPYQVVDVHELLNSTLVMLSAKLNDEITVVKDYDRTLPTVPVYAGELNQVWTNLIGNAISAMDGTGTLTVRTRRDHDYLLVEIGDTGPGVPEQIRSRIFEPFFTTKPFGEGTGLGLDIAWRIVVDKHRGDLRVESVPGDTRFQVRLPFGADAPVGSG